MKEAPAIDIYVMPWERPPPWLYLPHLAEAQPGVGQDRKRRKVGPAPSTDDGGSGHMNHEGRRIGDVVEQEVTERAFPAAMAARPDEVATWHRGRETECGQTNADTRGSGIRGQGLLPGARLRQETDAGHAWGGGNAVAQGGQGSTDAVSRHRPTACARSGEIRGQSDLPGAAGRSRREMTMASIQRLRAEQAALLTARGDRERLRPGASPSARLEALRARISARASSSNSAPVCSNARTEAATAAADHANGTRAEEQAGVEGLRSHQPVEEPASWRSRRDLLDHLRASVKPPERAI